MPEDLTAVPTRLSASEFLSVLERSDVLPATKLREVRDRYLPETARRDSASLAHQLVSDGMLTEFQARRLLVGKKGLAFGRYVLLDRIGKGARSRVFKARHRLMDRIVALKVVSPDYVLDPDSVGRFFREMKIVGMLDHPNVVRASMPTSTTDPRTSSWSIWKARTWMSCSCAGESCRGPRSSTSWRRLRGGSRTPTRRA